MIKTNSILIVDDEKNIRFTLTQALTSLAAEIDTAINAEEALEKIKQKSYSVMLLDLKLPGMDGISFLKMINEIRPEIRVIIITAHGSIEAAVDAMKLGAVDFIQKPFVPNEIRELVSQVLERETLDEKDVQDYNGFLELAKKSIGDHFIESAIEFVKKAINIDSKRPEAYNLLGVLLELQHDREGAQRNYRVALSLDPSYEPAQKNLSRTTHSSLNGKINLGE